MNPHDLPASAAGPHSAPRLIVIGHGMVGSFGQFSKGAISKAQMMKQMQMGSIIVGLVVVIMWVL